DSALLGNMHSFVHQENVGDVDKEYIEEYGLAFKIKGALKRDVLYLADPQGLQYVLNVSGYTFHKKHAAIRIRMLIGPNILSVEGEAHARHRRIMLPGFSQSALKEFVPVFLQTAEKVVGKWRDLLQDGQQSTVVDLYAWLSGLTLDVVGQGVLSHDFGALDDTPGEFVRVYRNLFVDMFHKSSDMAIAIGSLFGYLPIWVTIVLHKLTMRAAKRFSEYQAVSKNIALEIVQREMASLEGGLPQGKDIMSSLLRANMSETAKNKMSTEELLSQMSALTIAGHDTVTSTLTWILYELSRHPEIQNKLREEINATRAASASNEIGMNDFESMPYTIAVIKESLRYYPVAAHIPRTAGRDELIPLSRPVKTASGEEITAVPIKKGQRVLASMWGYNRIKDLWGEDAEQWNPDRFMGENLNLRPQKGLGVYANLATFSSGVHSCIGYAYFSVLELQTILTTLVQNFEFSPAPHNPIMLRAPAPNLVPMVKGEEKRGSQMPMSISSIN
ncbi:cytochrome P450, partial [Hysterangium stoloniferum]